MDQNIPISVSFLLEKYEWRSHEHTLDPLKTCWILNFQIISNKNFLKIRTSNVAYVTKKELTVYSYENATSGATSLDAQDETPQCHPVTLLWGSPKYLFGTKLQISFPWTRIDVVLKHSTKQIISIISLIGPFVLVIVNGIYSVKWSHWPREIYGIASNDLHRDNDLSVINTIQITNKLLSFLSHWRPKLGPKQFVVPPNAFVPDTHTHWDRFVHKKLADFLKLRASKIWRSE